MLKADNRTVQELAHQIIRKDQHLSFLIDKTIYNKPLYFRVLIVEDDKVRYPKTGDDKTSDMVISAHLLHNLTPNDADEARLDRAYDVTEELDKQGIVSVFDSKYSHEEIVEYLLTNKEVSVSDVGTLLLDNTGIITDLEVHQFIDEQGNKKPNINSWYIEPIKSTVSIGDTSYSIQGSNRVILARVIAA